MKQFIEDEISAERREFIINGFEGVYRNLSYGDSWRYGLINLLRELENADEIFYVGCLLGTKLSREFRDYEARPELLKETDLLAAFEQIKKAGSEALKIIDVAYLLKE